VQELKENVHITTGFRVASKKEILRHFPEFREGSKSLANLESVESFRSFTGKARARVTIWVGHAPIALLCESREGVKDQARKHCNRL